MRPFLIVRDWVPQMAALHQQGAERAGAFRRRSRGSTLDGPLRPDGSGPRADKAARVVLDQHNAVFQIPRRMAQVARNPAVRLTLRLEASKLAHYEQRTIRAVDRVTWVTEEDRMALHEFDRCEGHQAVGRVIPIAVDPEFVQADLPVDTPSSSERSSEAFTGRRTQKASSGSDGMCGRSFLQKYHGLC